MDILHMNALDADNLYMPPAIFNYTVKTIGMIFPLSSSFGRKEWGLK
jgi:hypothetical protein